MHLQMRPTLTAGITWYGRKGRRLKLEKPMAGLSA